MTGFDSRWFARTPLVILAGGAVAVAYALARFWGANPEHVDRFLIPLGAGYAAWDVFFGGPGRPGLRLATARPSRAGYLPLFVGAAAFPVGWFLHAQVGPKPVVLWWLAAAWVVAVAGSVLAASGWPHLRRLAFPLAFVLFALPVPNRVLVPLQFELQSATTTVAAWALPRLGVPVERSGFILSLPSGDLGVAEACSGVRSVTALTAIAAFVAWWRGFGPGRGLALVGLSIPVIAGVNAVRVVVSGLLQEHVGLEYVRGNWHEGLGIGMVLLGLGLIVGVASCLGGSPAPGSAHQPTAPPPRPASRRVAPALVLACSACATVAAHLAGFGVEREIVAAAPIDTIPHQLGRWNGSDLPVPEEVTEMLTPDAITRRLYRGDLGYEVHVWVIYWSSRNMVKGYHHPDVCWPNRGFRLVRREVAGAAVGRGSVPVTVREFAHGSAGKGESDRQLILYWTQEGRRVWSEQDERQAQATGTSHTWLEDRLFRRQPAEQTGRIVVLLGTQTWGDGAAIQTQTLQLAASVAEELYRVCPWAAPRE